MNELGQLFTTTAERAGSPAERAILRAAIELFGERGYGATSVRQIATAAGVTPPLISYHFRSKEGLFLACMDVVLRGMDEDVWRALDEASDFSDLVRALARVHLEFPKQHPQALRLLLTVFYGPEDARPEVDVMTGWVKVLGTVEARIRQAIESGAFEPRPGTDTVQLTRHLFRLLHMGMFESCEREKCGKLPGIDPGFLAPTGDPVEDLHDQFFHGAGRLAGKSQEPREEAP